jgi:hypothetical protein
MKHKKTIRQMSLLEFQQLFPDEQACRSYLEKTALGQWLLLLSMRGQSSFHH